MKNLTPLLLLFIICWAIQHPAGAQDVPYMDNAPDLFFDKIEPERLVSRVRDLAAPAFQGRELGTAGNQKAADWLEFTFRDAGLNPFFEDSFTQQFPVAYYQLGGKNKLHLVKTGPGSDVQSDSTLSLFTQFVPAYYSASDSATTRAVFAGNGKSSTYGKIRTEGNIAVILQDQPQKNQTNYYPDYLNKANIASSFGASGVIITVPPGHVTQQAPTGSFYRFQEIDMPVEAVKNLGNTAYPYVEPASINIPVVFTSSDVLPLLFSTENAKINLKDAIPELGQISKRMVHLLTDVDVAERKQASNVA